MNTTDPKPWYASKTIWAGLIVAALSAYKLFRPDHHIDVATIDTWATVLTMLGGLAAAAFRKTAKQTIRGNGGQD